MPNSILPTEIEIDGKPIEIQFQRNRRRKSRIRFYLHPEGELILACPFRTSDQQLAEIIEKNRNWIASRLRKMATNGEIFYPLHYRTGTIVHLLGKPHCIEIHPAQSNRVVVLDQQVHIDLTTDSSARHVYHIWVHGWAKEIFETSLSRMIELIDYDPRIRDWTHKYMASRWGACSSRGTLRFNTHLVKTPVDAIDSVVLHELCHRQILNHSPAFYGLMSKYMPDWHERDQLLRKYQGLLDEEIKLH